MLLHRQRRLLALLEQLGGSVGATDFQKLLFRFTREIEETPSYEFVPYKFGCFSFTAQSDRRKLIDRGYLQEIEINWVLQETPPKVPLDLRRKLYRFAKQTEGLRADGLIRDVYRRYPETAWRSGIAQRVLHDSVNLDRITAAKPIGYGPGLVTIGYEGRSPRFA